MSHGEQLRGMWEFPATWKLLHLLSVPLSFPPPSVAQLEIALLNPVEHLSLIADIHGRLVGLSAGNTAAKKWMQATARFVRNRLHEFSFLLEDPLNSTVPKQQPVEAQVKQEPQLEHPNNPEQSPTTQLNEDEQLTLEKPFPRNEHTYFRLTPSTRLLTLHTMAEIVLSEHDTLLCAGTIADLEPDQLRTHSFATDANGNNYWYFGDAFRVYREPGETIAKTRLQKAEDDAKAAEKAQKEAAEEETRLARVAKKKEAQRKQEEVKRRREERKRKQLEKWGPRVAATRSTRASRRAEAQAFLENRDDKDTEDSPTGSPAEMGESRNSQRGSAQNSERNQSNTEDSSDADFELNQNPGRRTSGRRTSGRRRKAPQVAEPPIVTTRTAKRPRKANVFADPELRNCKSWEVIAQGAYALQDLIDKFRSEDNGVLASERPLVRRLEENVLPLLLEKEEQERKEIEREEKKRRAEIILNTFTKRSSRVQARAQRREEEARRIAEEEEKERQRQERISRRSDIVRAQIVPLEKEQSRFIRNMRRAHGRTEAINRDDEIQKALDRKSARRDRATSETGLRRSTRAHRVSRRRMEMEDNFEEPEVVHNDTSSKHFDEDFEDGSKEEANGVQKHNETEGLANGLSDDIMEVVKGEEGQKTEAEKGESPRNESKYLEDTISEDLTWSINPDDGEPIRVVDKFFFVNESDFSDTPLENCEQNSSGVIGFGILLPPAESMANAKRVRIKDFEEWVIEYGEDARMWVRTKLAWYELRDPAVEYREAFKSARQKFELCIRISILGETMKSSQMTYDAVVELLGYRYEDMMAYAESDIVREKRFIVSQMQALNKKTVVSSGFMKELLKKIKQEDAKAEAAVRREEAKAQIMRTVDDQGNVESTTITPKSVDAEGKQRGVVPKKPARRRSSATGQPAVPRAVSSIITIVLRAATKSANPPRKRKRKADVAQEGEHADGHPKKVHKTESGLNGIMKVTMSVETKSENEDAQNEGTSATGKSLANGDNKTPVQANGMLPTVAQIEESVGEEKEQATVPKTVHDNRIVSGELNASKNGATESVAVEATNGEDAMQVEQQDAECNNVSKTATQGRQVMEVEGQWSKDPSEKNDAAMTLT